MRGKKTSSSFRESETEFVNEGGDIIELILEDHRPLKDLIEKLKDSDVDPGDKMVAFEEFASLLMIHAKPEEESLYTYMKNDEDLRTEGMEGQVEHELADQLIAEIKAESDPDMWQAKVKVLAEMVEHHIEEEEETLLPDFKKESSAEEREELGQKFMELKMTIPFDDLYMQIQRNSDKMRHHARH